MGLDATVYCDCYEQGRLRCAPPRNGKVAIDGSGQLYFRSDRDSIEDEVAFDRWLRDAACTHSQGELLYHRLGNISLIDLLREELGHEAQRFPLILQKVIYSGTHCGDFIPVADLPALSEEVSRLATHRCRDPEATGFMHEFTLQMRELVDAARKVSKPISF